jgi:hypothetical protein
MDVVWNVIPFRKLHILLRTQLTDDLPSVTLHPTKEEFLSVLWDCHHFDDVFIPISHGLNFAISVWHFLLLMTLRGFLQERKCCFYRLNGKKLFVSHTGRTGSIQNWTIYARVKRGIGEND